MNSMANSPMDRQASIWIECNQQGFAACPHCERLSWSSGLAAPWRAGCDHVINPGTVERRETPTGPKTVHPAIIFKGDK